MDDQTKDIERLKTDVISLKIRLKGIEDFINAFPTAEEHLTNEQRMDISAFVDGSEDLVATAIKIVVEYDKASASLLQRRLSIGYARAARLLDTLTKKGYLSDSDTDLSKPREVMKEKIYEDFPELEELYSKE